MAGPTLAEQIEVEIVPAPHAPAGAAGSGDEHPLREAFQRFKNASEKLQRKYELLLGETKLLRAQLAAKEDEMKRAERLAMLGETAAGIAHEVRNPLGAIKLFVSLLRQDLAEQQGPLELVLQIEKSITCLDNVVSNILQFSKDSKPVFAPVNLHAIIREQLTQFAATHGGVQLRQALEGNPFIQGNEAGLRQVIYNLVLNALQAAGADGTVEVACRDDETGRVMLTVRDDGKGIDPGVLDRMFEPFVSTKNEGTGLGLAIVKRIADQHGAALGALNKGGAEFTVTFTRGAQA